MYRDDWMLRIKSYMSERRFEHTKGVTDVATTLSNCYGLNEDLVWKAAMLHDIARDISKEDMSRIADKYGHKMSDISLQYEENMHAEVGALIAEYEFGLTDSDALNAIRYHVCARPDMSTLEKILFFSDHAEPKRPNQPMMRNLIEIAKTDLDLAILRMLQTVIDYFLSHNVSENICEICSEAYDFLLDEYCRKDYTDSQSHTNNDMLTDEEFDEAIALLRSNRIKMKSVENARWLNGFTADDGRKVKDGLLIRSGNLSRLTKEESDNLRDGYNLSLIIDLRTSAEVTQTPDIDISGIRYENIPLAKELDTGRMDYLANRYLHSQTENERAWYTEQYARIGEVIRMYKSISTEHHSIDAVHRVFHLLGEAEGTVLIHCTSGKDRTGIIAALILYALGCSREDIIRDYNASAVTFFSRTENIKNDLGARRDEEKLQYGLQTSISVVPEVLGAGLYYIDNNYPSHGSFVLEATGFNQNELEAFRNKYLERDK